jgi:hypothetical protein
MEDTRMAAHTLVHEAAAVPIVTEQLSGLTGGSGFLAWLQGETLLVTVAHHATGLNSNTDVWADWMPRLHVPMGPAPSPGQPIPVHPSPIELFELTAEGKRVPRFRYVRPAGTPGFVADVIAVPVQDTWDWTANVPVIDLDAIDGGPSTGQSAVVWGFPVGVGDQWPSRRSVSGPTVGLSGPGPALLLIDMQVTVGFSGAPVFVDDGRFVGMAIGESNDGKSHAQLLTPGIIRMAAPEPGGLLVPGTFQNF